MENDIFFASAVSGILGALTYVFTHENNDISGISSIPYRRFYEECDTGDLILATNFRSPSYTRIITNSNWSHCGIVLKIKGRLYEWSSHTSDAKLVNSKGVRSYHGPQIVSLENIVSKYSCIYWRKINCNKEQKTKIEEIANTLAYKITYSKTAEFLTWFGNPFKYIFENYGSGMACSHIVAMTYIQVGIISPDRKLSQYIPKDFDGDVLWKAPILPIKMVLGFDMKNLIKI